MDPYSYAGMLQETYKYLIQIHFKLCSTILNFSIKKITVKYFTHKMLYTGDNQLSDCASSFTAASVYTALDINVWYVHSLNERASAIQTVPHRSV